MVKKDFEGMECIESFKKVVRTRRIIIFTAIIFAALPLLLAWMIGSLRF